MKSASFRTLRHLPLLLVFASLGCGRAAIVPVQGKVSYRGYGVNNGLVVFTPDQRGTIAVGRIREDGSYVLYTGDTPGAYPGHYRVTVCSLTASSAADTFGRYEFPRSAIPDRYRDPELSRLAQSIQPGRQNVLDIDLSDRE